MGDIDAFIRVPRPDDKHEVSDNYTVAEITLEVAYRNLIFTIDTKMSI